MKRRIATLTLIFPLLMLGTAACLRAQAKTSAPFAPGLASPLPPRAVVGSTPERREAWQKLTPKQREEYVEKFKALVGDALKEAAERQGRSVEGSRWVRSDLLGKRIQSLAPDSGFQGRSLVLTDRSGTVASREVRRPIEEPFPEDPGPGQPPQAGISAWPTAGAAPLTVQFDGLAYDPDGWIVSVYWDFGDGGWASGLSPIHTYTSPGVYTAWLTVVDDTGLSAWAAIDITVSGGGNLPPAVSASGSPLSGSAPLSVGFNAAASDPDGWIVSYVWNFGDGQFSNQDSPVHSYAAGSYTATVTVTDNAGASASASLGVQVSPAGGSGTDADGDGLPDGFEDSLADAFTPVYHMSGGEQSGTGFARFADSPSLSIVQNLPLVPPTVHLRATPVGFATDVYGRQLGFLQIDYLTILNRDDGLSIGGDCRFFASILGGLAGLGITDLFQLLGPGHEFDQERSATLVAAPTVAGQYSTDPASYQAYDYYTAAHEGTFTDHSGYFSPSQPVPAYYHLNLALSKSKHSTYPFNPDYYPLVPGWMIGATYGAIDAYYWGCWEWGWNCNYYNYILYLYMADTVFFDCIVEHFQEQGGSFPGLQLNVGELGQPLNGSGFINDPRVRSKLTPLLWRIQ
jgi:PKD repeat protein